MKRDIEKQLESWRNSPDRKPLLLQGARQVGKTYTLKSFGSQRYERIAYFNFEEDPALNEIFEGRLMPQRLIDLLSVYCGHRIEPATTLLIFDEIQESNRALNALKYFCETAPEYHVVGAGSLLGVKLSRPASFPVGKVQLMSLRPLSFFEFLESCGEGELRRLVEEWPRIEPIPTPLHERLVELLKYYYLVGGMPEVVAKFAKDRDIGACCRLQEHILATYQMDFAKHAPKSDIPKIGMIWNSLPAQLARENKKFVFSTVRKSARSREYESALNWLENSGLIFRCKQLSVPRLPLSSYASEAAFKLYFIDTGLLCALSGLDPKVLIRGSALFTEFHGSLAENYVAQALSLRALGLYYWSSAGTAEVDFVCQVEGDVYPLEVKAGINPRSKSLRVYGERYGAPMLSRMTLLNFRRDGAICNYPLYAVSLFPKLALR